MSQADHLTVHHAVQAIASASTPGEAKAVGEALWAQARASMLLLCIETARACPDEWNPKYVAGALEKLRKR